MNDSGLPQAFFVQAGSSFHLFNFPNDPDSVIGTLITFTNQAGSSSGSVSFESTSSAGDGTFINEGGSVAGQTGGLVQFIGTATAGSGTLINQGATAPGAKGGRTIFVQQFPGAANATLIAEGGSNGGAGGTIGFYDASTGGTARIEVFGNGYADVSGRTKSTFTIGSLEGDGGAYLGRQNVSVGSNNLSTTFSGIMYPGGPTGGGSDTGALTKIETGTLTLTGANLYTAGTTITAGTLVMSNKSGSGTGTGAVTVNGGTLGGSGTISGAVALNSGAFIAPTAGTKKQATLTIQTSLTFNSGSAYTCTFKAKGNKARTDKVVANGVTIASVSTFDFSGQAQGTLRTGLTLTVISNTSASPISGTFSNLPDGAIVTIGSNNFQANYEGGDGNDLTLTCNDCRRSASRSVNGTKAPVKARTGLRAWRVLGCGCMLKRRSAVKDSARAFRHARIN